MLALARQVGCETPVYQVTPVFAAEAGGVRRLMPGEIPVLALHAPEALGAAYLAGLLWSDPVTALRRLVFPALAVAEGERYDPAPISGDKPAKRI